MSNNDLSNNSSSESSGSLNGGSNNHLSNDSRTHDHNPLTILTILLIILLIFVIWFWIIIQGKVAPTVAIGRIRDETNIVLGEVEWIIESNNHNTEYYMVISNPPGDIIDGGFYLSVDNEWSLLKSVNFVQRGTSVVWVAVGSWNSTNSSQPLTGAVIDQLYQGNIYVRAITSNEALSGQMEIITQI